MRTLTREPPEVLVVDLSRLPGQGRDVGIIVRLSKLGRSVPIVFVDGEPAKVARARAALPDAHFTTWDEIAAALESARQPPSGDPVVPESALAGYAGTPTPKKLGISDDCRVRVLSAPDGFEQLLAPLPAAASVGAGIASPDLVLCFTRDKRDLVKLWPRATRARVPTWVFWPKRSAGHPRCDLDQRVVRAYGLDHGWVDHKIARLDATWAGLRFVERRSLAGWSRKHALNSSRPASRP